MSKPLPPSDAAPATPLERALDQNSNVRDTVELSSAELAVINTVLKHELPGDVIKGVVAQALEKTDELEVKIQETAQDLAEVNQLLAQEIDARMDLEGEVATIKAELEREKAKP
jgi:hypothetical protein